MIIAISLLTGCATKYQTVFPAPINSVSYGCMNQSKAILESTGKSLKVCSDCYVTEHPGENNVGGLWAWYVPACNGYVTGTCSGNRIEIACNPRNLADICVPALTHEMAHYWLITNYGDWTHNPIYDRYFLNWKLSREVQGRMVRVSTKDSTGLVTYYDVVEFCK